MKMLLEDQLHSRGCGGEAEVFLPVFHLAISPLLSRCPVWQRIATVAPELENSQTHPRLGPCEARAGTLWSGRNYTIFGEMH